MSPRCLPVPAFLLGACLAAPVQAQAPDIAELSKKPIAIGGGEVGDLLRKWWQEGTAAGNAGDFYDNRDGGHSDLDTKPYPQLQRIVYSAEDIKQRKHWAAQRTTLPLVVFGNSSTSAPPLQGGSNVRMYYTAPVGLALLYNHYTHNNMYIYPEHRDHDPGHNGRGDGFGDLYPTNAPYLITSQGSSGSDQPFMRALPYTLAAFRPEVKKKLVESGLLMPTVQMILRSCNRHLKDPAEYLTGKAHPSVFEGSWVDAPKMVRLAHAIEAGNLPPMVRLRVLKEDQPVLGKDFFDATLSEKLADTPCCIARIVRGRERLRRMVVSAEASYDLNKRPLTFRWVVLRGDPAQIKITPQNEAGSVAELVVPYHPRRPVALGSPLESNRVDIGVFVHNGVYNSAPAFVTFFSLDSEARTYDGRGSILEIGYENGEVNLSVADWGRLLELAAGGSAAGRLLPLTAAQRRTAAAARQGYEELHAARKAAAAALKEAEAGLRRVQARLPKDKLKATLEEVAEAARAEGRLQAARKADEAAARAVTDFLARRVGPVNGSLKDQLELALRQVMENSVFAVDNAAVLNNLTAAASVQRQAVLKAALKRLVAFGLAADRPSLPLSLTPLRPGTVRPAERLTAYEDVLLQRYNAVLLTELICPGIVTATFQPNFVDQRLSAPKLWRDVYHHAPDDTTLGWTRYDGVKAASFNADGLLILEKDDLGRCRRAQSVRYFLDAKVKVGYGQRPQRFAPDKEIVTYAYSGDDDRRGHIKSREPAPGTAAADAPAFRKKSYTYKTVGETKIQADVYRADDRKMRPVVVWIHGGALVLGSRTGVPKDLLDLCRDEGYVLVSIDYRLAPEVKLPDIIADVRDASRWLRERGPKQLACDPDRLVVAGGSAGGYLTLMTGLEVKPRPRALVAYWGYGDVDGDWYTKPSDFYRKQVPLVSKEEAYQAVGQAALTGTASAAEQRARGRYYHYLRQNGLWTKEVTGFNPATERAKLDPYCPVRNVTADYPPTLLIHGTEDTDVPYELSAAMDRELTRRKVVHELITVRGAGHGLSGGDRTAVAQAHERALAFIRKHLR
jgi:acetyl esterase/lipase